MNFKLRHNRVIITCVCLLIAGATTPTRAFASDDYLSQRPYSDWGGSGYPNDRYPNDRYNNNNGPYRYSGQGELNNGERNYRCSTLIVDFNAPRARVKCDGFQVTFQKGTSDSNNRADYNLIQVDTGRNYRDEFDAEVTCNMNADSYQPERLSQFQCDGSYRDNEGRSRRLRVDFEASSGQPIPQY